MTPLETLDQWLKEANIDTNVCVSGGAMGADSAWETIALKHHHNVAIMSFEGHSAVSSKNSRLIKLTREELLSAMKWLKQANKHLLRPNFDYDLLRRNYYQIKYSTLLYAISNKDESKAKKTSVGVEGGTAWACQMFLLNYLETFNKDSSDDYAIPMFLYDMKSKQWNRGYATFDNGQFCQFEWRTITYQPPTPFGIYTGIGSRKLSVDGRKALSQLFEIDK